MRSRIAWRLQADAEGGLTERALQRAAELANDADVRVTPPRHGAKPLAVHAAGGAAVVGAVRINDWERPSPDLEVKRFVLSAHRPSVLYIPAGYANGFMSLTDDTLLMFFSTSTLEESKGDDYRFPARLWDVWSVEER